MQCTGAAKPGVFEWTITCRGPVLLNVILPMNTQQELIPLGSFVRVHTSVGVVVGWPNNDGVPEEHYAIWYGETSDSNAPLCRTGPMEHCEATLDTEFYH